MEGKVYHGSPNGNLKILEQRVSTHGKSCIYATDNRVIALLFAGKGLGDLDTVIAKIDGRLCLVERREGVLEKIYNKAGYLYQLDGATFNHYDYLWSQEVISFEPVEIEQMTKIDNLLEEIEFESYQDHIDIYRYPNRPQNIPLDNSDLIDKYIEFEQKGKKGAIAYLLSVYPEFEDIVADRLNNEETQKKRI